MIGGMRKESRAANVAVYRPRPQLLIAVIRRIAAVTANIDWREHALDRMDERGITTEDALRVLRVGEICGEIKAGKHPGEWKCKVVERRKRSRDIGVVTIVIHEGRLAVATVEWEDV